MKMQRRAAEVAWPRKGRCCERSVWGDTRQTRAVALLQVSSVVAGLHAFVIFWSICAFSITGKPALAETPATRPKRPHVLAEFDIDKDGAPVIVPVTISGHTYRLLLDTGAGCTGVDRGHRAALGKAIGEADMKTLGGLTNVELLRVRSVKIGDIRIGRPLDICCVDLRAFKDANGEGLDGLLGMDILRCFVVEIDFAVGKLRFRDAPVNAGRAVQLCWDDDPTIAIADRCPYVRGVLNGDIEGKFLVDTGGTVAISGLLEEQIYDALFKSGNLAPIPAAPDEHIFHIAGRIPMIRGRLSSFALAGHRHLQLAFLRVPGESCLGLSYLSRYCVTFDFPNSTMYLRPGKAFGRRDVFDLSGLRLVKRDSAIMCDWVRERSAGETAGVMAGDIITAIDGQPANELNLFSARRALSVEGRHVVDLSRDGVAKRLDLHLVEPPPPRAAVNRPQSRSADPGGL